MVHSVRWMFHLDVVVNPYACKVPVKYTCDQHLTVFHWTKSQVFLSHLSRLCLTFIVHPFLPQTCGCWEYCPVILCFVVHHFVSQTVAGCIGLWPLGCAFLFPTDGGLVVTGCLVIRAHDRNLPILFGERRGEHTDWGVSAHPEDWPQAAQQLVTRDEGLYPQADDQGPQQTSWCQRCPRDQATQILQGKSPCWQIVDIFFVYISLSLLAPSPICPFVSLPLSSSTPLHSLLPPLPWSCLYH